ncbi:MAG: hypothetical protein GWO24_36795 [Akkermansiaceae bacterium]|nr:hypothetical protein [Akkermansiaceae bacterium]
MARDLSLSLNARLELSSNPQRALDLIESARPEDWWNPEIFGATVFNWTIERFLRAELLWRLGRHEEALPWFEGLVVDPSSLPFRPVKHLRLGEIHEERGRLDRAAWHFGRVITLLNECDEEWSPVKEAAAQGLRRVGREGSGQGQRPAAPPSRTR